MWTNSGVSSCWSDQKAMKDRRNKNGTQKVHKTTDSGGGLSNRRDWLHFLMRNYNFTSRMCTKRTFTRLTIKDCGIRVYDWFPLILMIPSRTAALIPGTSWTPLEKSPLLGCTHLIQIKTRHVLPTDNWHWRWKVPLMKVNKLGQVHTAVNPCPQCKVNGYKTYGQFTKRLLVKHTKGL